jgi:hypothetical protein
MASSKMLHIGDMLLDGTCIRGTGALQSAVDLIACRIIMGMLQAGRVLGI